MPSPAPYRAVTSREDVARVLDYLSGHFPYSLKLYCTIRSWQQQAEEAATEDDLIEPTHPSLFVSCPSYPDSPEFDAVVLIFGSSLKSIGAREAEAAAAEKAHNPTIITSTTSTSSATKLPYPIHDIFITFFAQAGSDEAVYSVLAAVVPSSVPFQFHLFPAEFTDTVVKRLARERNAGLVHSLHQQWIRLPPAKDGRPAQTNIKFIEPAAASQFQTRRTSPSLAPAATAPTTNTATTITTTTAAAAVTVSPSSSASDVSRLADSTSPSVVVGPLGLEHVPLVARHWPYASVDTPRVLHHIFPRLPSSCVFVDSEPACWCSIQTYGGLGMLHTQPDHRGRGYARLVIDALCDAQYARGETPFCFVRTNNVASQKVFANMAFRPTHNVDWVDWVPSRYQTPNDPHAAAAAQ